MPDAVHPGYPETVLIVELADARDGGQADEYDDAQKYDRGNVERRAETTGLSDEGQRDNGA